MAPLTWRNVDAPSFAASNDLLRYAGQAFNSGLDAAEGAVDKFHNSQINDASNRAILNALGITDPNQFDAALKSGTIVSNLNPNNLSAEALKFLSGRTGDLIQNNQARSNLTGTDINNRSGLIDLSTKDITYDDMLRERDWTNQARDFINKNLGNFTDPTSALRLAQGTIKDANVLQKVVGLLNDNAGAIFPAAANPSEKLLLDAQNAASPSATVPPVTAPVTGPITPANIKNDPVSASVSNTESSNNDKADNGQGFVGGQQFGVARLQDAKNAGVIPKDMTLNDFKNDSNAQREVEAWNRNDINTYAAQNGITKHYGEVINGVPINEASVFAMAHLGGKAGMKKFIESGGTYNPEDSNGTSLSEYGRTHAGSTRFGGVAGDGTSTQNRPGSGNPYVTDLSQFTPGGTPTIAPQTLPAGYDPSLPVPGNEALNKLAAAQREFDAANQAKKTADQTAANTAANTQIATAANDSVSNADVVTDPAKYATLVARTLTNQQGIDTISNDLAAVDNKINTRPDLNKDRNSLIKESSDETGLSEDYIQRVYDQVNDVNPEIVKYAIQQSTVAKDPDIVSGLVNGVTELFGGKGRYDKRIDLQKVKDIVETYKSLNEGSARVSTLQNSEAIKPQVDQINAAIKLVQDKYDQAIGASLIPGRKVDIPAAKAEYEANMALLTQKLFDLGPAARAYNKSLANADTKKEDTPPKEDVPKK